MLLLSIGPAVSFFNCLVWAAFFLAVFFSLAPSLAGAVIFATAALLIFSRTARRAVLWFLAAIAGLLALEWIERRLRRAISKDVIMLKPWRDADIWRAGKRFRKPQKNYVPFDDEIDF